MAKQFYMKMSLALSFLFVVAFNVSANRLIFEASFETIEKPDLFNTGPYDYSILLPSGSMTITTDGAVIENIDLTGRIKIEANDVTIRNFRINAEGTSYGIQTNSGHTGLLLENGEIFNMSSAAILGAGFTALRLNVHDSGGDGFKVQGGTEPTLVAYSWIHHLGKNDGAHADGNQSRSGANITFFYNNCDMPITDPSPYKSNACFMLQTAEGPLDNMTIKNNWLNGGNYTLYCAGTRLNVTGNQFGRDYRFGIRNDCDNEDTIWANNVWEDTGEVIP